MIRNINGTHLARNIEHACNETFKWAVAKKFEHTCNGCGGFGEVTGCGEPGLGSAAMMPCMKCNGTGSGYRNFAEQVALVHSELSELLEDHRTGKGVEPDEKCPKFTKAEIEAADAVIRLMCMSGAYGWRLGRAIEAKMAYNWTRPEKHGKRY